MKKIILLLFFLFSICNIFALVYRSNELGSELEVIEKRTNNGWEKDGNTLYYNGNVKEKRTDFSFGYTIERENEKETVYILNNKIERRVIECNNKREEYNYFYSDELLSSINYFEGEKLNIIKYVRDHNGRLALVIINDEKLYFSENGLIIENSDEVSSLSKELETKDETITTLDNGEYSVETIDKKSIYSSTGRLLREESKKESKEYSYSVEGELLTVITKREGTTEEAIYENGKLNRTLYFDDSGNIIKEVKIRIDGTIEEIRKLGNVTYRFIYESDGKRIREATII